MAKHGGFPGMGMGGNLQNLARQAQKLQQQMTEKPQELEAREFEASAGGGMVTCKVSGKHEITALTIKPEAVDPDDVEMLQDLILAAVNEALRAADADKENTLGRMAPAGMGGLF